MIEPHQSVFCDFRSNRAEITIKTDWEHVSSFATSKTTDEIILVPGSDAMIQLSMVTALASAAELSQAGDTARSSCSNPRYDAAVE